MCVCVCVCVYICIYILCPMSIYWIWSYISVSILYITVHIYTSPPGLIYILYGYYISPIWDIWYYRTVRCYYIHHYARYHHIYHIYTIYIYPYIYAHSSIFKSKRRVALSESKRTSLSIHTMNFYHFSGKSYLIFTNWDSSELLTWVRRISYNMLTLVKHIEIQT